jgi:hypothetical protein
MACDCSNMTPYQRLGALWNEVMGLRSSLSETEFEPVTRILIEMDAIMLGLQKDTPTLDTPLYTTLCYRTEAPHA